MASTSKRNRITVAATWIDITTVSGFTDIASVDVVIQSLGVLPVQIIFGGTVPADTDYGGFFLSPSNQSCSGNSDHIWVRGTAGSQLTITIEA